jgi:hypothetical protein
MLEVHWIQYEGDSTEIKQEFNRYDIEYILRIVIDKVIAYHDEMLFVDFNGTTNVHHILFLRTHHSPKRIEKSWFGTIRFDSISLQVALIRCDPSIRNPNPIRYTFLAMTIDPIRLDSIRLDSICLFWKIERTISMLSGQSFYRNEQS